MIERNDIDHLAELALLEIADEEAEALRGEIDSIVGYVSELSDVAADDAAPEAGEVRNVMREDGVPHESNLHTEALLSAAPKRSGQYVAVKKIL